VITKWQLALAAKCRCLLFEGSGGSGRGVVRPGADLEQDE